MSEHIEEQEQWEETPPTAVEETPAPAQEVDVAPKKKDEEVVSDGPQPWPQGPDYDPREDPGPVRVEDLPAEDA